jgi:hypothetical protein
VRVRESRCDFYLAQKAHCAEGVGKISVKDLDRDASVVLEVFGEIHRGHSTLPKLALNRVPVSQRAAQCVERIDGVCHGRSNVRFRGWCGNRTVVTSSGPTRLQVRSESWSCRDTQINSVRAK